MRTRRLFATLGFIAAITVATPLFTGCPALDPSGAYHGDKALYDADLVITSSYSVVDNFLLFELHNRKSLPPKVTAAADAIRKEAPRAFQTAIALRDAYKGNPTADGRSNLVKAIDVIREMASQATSYLVQQTTNPNVSQ